MAADMPTSPGSIIGIYYLLAQALAWFDKVAGKLTAETVG
jgi:hypothetical protein